VQSEHDFLRSIASVDSMPIEIQPITYGDIPGAARCIQEAFADDPYNNWVFDKSKVCKQGVVPPFLAQPSA
jgi:hypothetical protein